MNAKDGIRTTMRRLLGGTSPEQRRAASEAVCGRVRQLPDWAEFRRVLLFAPLAGELDLFPLLSEDTDGRTFCVPRVESADPPTLAAVPVRLPPPGRGWRRGPFGLWEPDGEPIDPRLIDLALVPGLAFTPRGDRLGRGKGFYDFFLPTLSPACLTCGVGLDLQVLGTLPVEAHDVPLHTVITPASVHDPAV